MLRRRFCVATAAVFLITACAHDEEAAGPIPEGLTVVERTSEVLEATFAEKGQEILLASYAASDSTVAVSVVVNGKPFDLTVAWAKSTIASDGHGNALSLDETDALAAFADALAPALAGKGARVATIAAGQVAHLARAPVGLEIGAEASPPPVDPDEPVAYSLANDGRIHIKKGSKRCGKYDGGGKVHSFCATVGADWGTNDCGWGNYDCMGRCGPGCGTGSYCVDCLEHDACSENFCGGPKCDDEWRHARDDYLLGC